MSNTERRLGRGLDSLISAARADRLDADAIQASGKRIERVGLSRIRPNPFQPRTNFELEPLNELVESLRAHGLMQPIVLRRKPSGFEIVAGERRFRAATELGWDSIDALVVEADDRRMLEWALVENIQREQLSPIELARSLADLIERHGASQADAGKAVGMSRPAVSNHLRLLELPDDLQEMVSRGTLSMGAARALLPLENAEVQRETALAAVAGGWSVRQLEEAVRTHQAAPESAPDTTASPGKRTVRPDAAELAGQIEALLGCKAEVRGTGRKGKLILHYGSREELEGLLRRMTPQQGSQASEHGGLSEDRLTV